MDNERHINYQHIVDLEKKYLSDNYQKKHDYQWYCDYIKKACYQLEMKYKPYKKEIKIKIADIELELYNILLEIDLTRIEFVRIIQDLGICLSNFHSYGSENKLRKILYDYPRLKIDKNKVKLRIAKKITEIPGYPKFQKFSKNQISFIKYYTSNFFAKLKHYPMYDEKTKEYCYKFRYNKKHHYSRDYFFTKEDFYLFTRYDYQFLKSLLIELNPDSKNGEGRKKDNEDFEIDFDMFNYYDQNNDEHYDNFEDYDYENDFDFEDINHYRRKK